MSLTEGTPLTAAMNYVWDMEMGAAHKRLLCQVSEQDTDYVEQAWLDIPVAPRYQIMVVWAMVRRMVLENEGAFDKIKALRHGETA